jgi:hypothetical protein
MQTDRNVDSRLGASIAPTAYGGLDAGGASARALLFRCRSTKRFENHPATTSRGALTPLHARQFIGFAA